MNTATTQSQALHVFEVTGAGFDGEDDKTDDRVFWVAATSARIVRDAIGKRTRAEFCGRIAVTPDEPGVDFRLPAQKDELRAALFRCIAADFDGESGYRVRYRCPECGERWSQTWSCACDDECGNCGIDVGALSYTLDGTIPAEALDAYNDSGRKPNATTPGSDPAKLARRRELFAQRRTAEQ